MRELPLTHIDEEHRARGGYRLIGRDYLNGAVKEDRDIRLRPEASWPGG